MMCAESKSVKNQLALTISKIANMDWPDAIRVVMTELAVERYDKINCLLDTLDLTFKNWCEFSSLSVVNFIESVSATLTKCFIKVMMEIQHRRTDFSELYESIRLIANILYSICFQWLPQTIEENMADWMREFNKLLSKELPSSRSEAKVMILHWLLT